MHRRIVVTLCLAILLAAGAALAAGTVEEVTFYSEALGMEKSLQVYLPEGYETSGLEYPVVYFLHGMTQNYLGFPEVIDAAEQVIADGWVEPFILVKPDVNCTPFADGGFPEPVPSSLTNSELTGDYETYFVEDLVGWVDATFRTLADRDHRFVTGHSQGGYGAMRAALRHPDLFAKVGSHAGALAIEVMGGFGTVLLGPDYPGEPPFDYRPDAGFFSKYAFALAAAFAPNLSNPPWYVDFPYDANMQPIPDVWLRFTAQSNSTWATEFAASDSDLGIYLECGTLDEMGANYINQYFAGVLDALQIPYTLRWFEGTHGSHVGLRMPIQLSFFMPLNAIAESPHHFFNPRRGWPVQEFMLELPGDLEAELIAFDTIEITEINGVELASALRPLVSHALSDVNGNGQQDLTIWFSAHQLAGAMRDVGVDVPSNVDVVLRGETTDELFWEGTETLFVPVLEK